MPKEIKTEPAGSTPPLIAVTPGPLGDGSISLWDLLLIAYARKCLICSITFGFGLVSAGIALLTPNTYTASAVILPPQKEQSSLSLLAGQLGPMAAVAGTDFGLKTPSDLYISLLSSRTIADRLIKQYGLSALYKTKTASDTRNVLKARSRFSPVRNSLIKIDVDDWDPDRAADLANAYVDELQVQNTSLSVTEASQRRQFLQKQLADEKAALSQAENTLKQTQQQTGVIDVSGQTQVAIASLAQIRAQITAGEVALERLRMGATSQNPEVVQTEHQLAALRKQLHDLGNFSEPGVSLVAASALPQAGLEYIRRLRELKYHEFLFELLSRQYEAARIDESKASPAIQVVDRAIPPDKKSGPPRAVYVFLGCFSGAGFATLLAWFQWRRSAAIALRQTVANN